MFSIDDVRSILENRENITDSWIDALHLIDAEYPYRKEDFYWGIKPAVAKTQTWWKDEVLALGLKPKTAAILAPGYAMFSLSMLRSLGVTDVTLYDFDREVVEVNWRLNKYDETQMNFNQECLDVVFDKEYIDTNVDIVINTSCAMMIHFYKLIQSWPKDTIKVLQRTNKHIKGNINVVESLDEFIMTTGIKDIIYEGTLEIDDCERYMVIGK